MYLCHLMWQGDANESVCTAPFIVGWPRSTRTAFRNNKKQIDFQFIIFPYEDSVDVTRPCHITDV